MKKIPTITICVTKEEQKILKNFYDTVCKDTNISNDDSIDILDSIAKECPLTNNDYIKIDFKEE